MRLECALLHYFGGDENYQYGTHMDMLHVLALAMHIYGKYDPLLIHVHIHACTTQYSYTSIIVKNGY